MTDTGESVAWRTAHDALARHGRARIAKADESTLIGLWQDYCIALDDACSVPHIGSQDGAK